MVEGETTVECKKLSPSLNLLRPYTGFKAQVFKLWSEVFCERKVAVSKPCPTLQVLSPAFLHGLPSPKPHKY